jgi:hypothetical protein
MSLANTAWTAYKEYQLARIKPTIEIHSRTSYPLQVPISMDELLGDSLPDPEYASRPSPKISTPYFPVVLTIHNPTGRKSSLSNCTLHIRFYERNGEHESLSYLTDDLLKSGRVQQAPILTIESGATTKVSWLFFFLPTPQFEALLADKTTQAFRFQVVCHDETQNEIRSRWR